jgi:GT2 family glycosyltransferase
MFPHVSFVIPCRPGETPKEAIEAIKKLDYPQEKIEIIVEKGLNPPNQRNRGIKKSTGEIIAFIDDDCNFKRNWLQKAVKYFENEKVGIVGGPNLTPKCDSFLSHCFGYAMSSFFGTASMSYRYKLANETREATEQRLILANMLCRRSIFEKEIYFNEKLFPNEENEFMNRVAKQGYLMLYAPDIYVYHPRKKTVRGFAKQLFGYGSGRARQSIIQPDSFSPLYTFPSIFALALALIPISIAMNLRSLSTLLALCFSLYFIIAFTVSTIKSIKHRNPRVLFILPLLFLVLHLSYGAGFLGAFIRKENIELAGEGALLTKTARVFQTVFIFLGLASILKKS